MDFHGSVNLQGTNIRILRCFEVRPYKCFIPEAFIGSRKFFISTPQPAIHPPKRHEATVGRSVWQVFGGWEFFVPSKTVEKLRKCPWLDDLMTRTCDFLMVSWNKSLVVWRHLLCTTGSIHGHMSNDLWCYCMERFAARTLQSLEMDRVFRRPRVGKKQLQALQGSLKPKHMDLYKGNPSKLP